MTILLQTCTLLTCTSIVKRVLGLIRQNDDVDLMDNGIYIANDDVLIKLNDFYVQHSVILFI